MWKNDAMKNLKTVEVFLVKKLPD